MKRFNLLTYLRRTQNWWQPILALMAGAGLIAVFAYMQHQRVEAERLADAQKVATTTPIVNSFAGISLIGQAAIVYDLTTGETLFSRNADEALPLASLTKLLTAYAAAETLSPQSPVMITPTALAQEGESGFAAGETFAFADLARLALVSSSNDATQAIAEAADARRSVESAQLLSAAAASIGLEHTRATNGTGLDESPTRAGAYGSARDMAKLAGALLTKAPDIAHATIEPSFTIVSREGVTHTLPNTNHDVVEVPGILLSKTGYTDLAGGNLVVVFDAGISHPVAIAVLGSTREGRFTDVHTLVEATLAQFANLKP